MKNLRGYVSRQFCVAGWLTEFQYQTLKSWTRVRRCRRSATMDAATAEFAVSSDCDRPASQAMRYTRNANAYQRHEGETCRLTVQGPRPDPRPDQRRAEAVSIASAPCMPPPQCP